MKSGIYKLIFNNGSTYIGKSNNFDRRFEEHARKLGTGTAASKLQAAYDASGFNRLEILVTCHPDHIDIMETCMIALHKPDLNAAGTGRVEDMKFLLEAKYLDKSTAEHLRMIYDLESDNERLVQKLITKKRSELESELEKSYEHSRYWHEKYKKERDRFWWKKLFGLQG